MIMIGGVLAFVFSILGFLLSLQGLWLLCLALWPRQVEAAAWRCQHNGIKSFLVGLPVSGVVVLLAILVAQRLGAPGQIASFAILFCWIMFGGAGVAGLVTHIGRRLSSPADADRPWRATVRGAVALELACLIPFLGWFCLLPVSFVLGTGAMTLVVVRQAIGTRRRAAAPAAVTFPSTDAAPVRQLPALEPAEALS